MGKSLMSKIRLSEHMLVDEHSVSNSRLAGYQPAMHNDQSQSNNDNWVHALIRRLKRWRKNPLSSVQSVQRRAKPALDRPFGLATLWGLACLTSIFRSNTQATM
jgi:hypothetical protein